MQKIFEKHYKLFFLAVAILLLYPTLQKGYIMLLDWKLLPDIAFADINWRLDSIGIITYKTLAIVLGFGTVQRIVLFAIVFFAGTAGFRLARRTGSLFAQYFAGLFLIFNPFVYARAIEQPNIAGGTVLFFWFLVYFLEYLEERKTKKLVQASILAAFSVSFIIHSTFFIGLSLLVFLGAEYLRKKDWRFSVKTFLMIFGCIILLNANWIISFAFGTSQGIGGIRNFSLEDTQTFDTSGINGGSVYFAVLALQGYWGEYQNRFVPISENPLWLIAFALIFALAVLGASKRWKKELFVKPLAVLFWIAFVLAIGIASPLFKPLALWLYQNMPLYIGLREPQKWVAVMLFVYAYLGGWGIKYLLAMRQLKNYRLEVGIFCAFLPIIFSFSAIQGMHEHFTPHEFPAEWQEAKNYLEKSPNQGKVLFFPWHSYLELDFAGKNVTNPARQFFGKNIIRANNTEFGRLYSHYADPQTLAIEKYVVKKDNPAEGVGYQNFPTDMEQFEIRLVILAKTEDWQKYLWLDRIDARKILENDKLIIYALR